MAFKPSKFQKNIFKFIIHEKGSAIIEAVAGSGKTTTIVEALKKIPASLRTVFLAFNKSISEEIKRRVPPNVKVQTLNGLGHGAWMRFVDGNVRLNQHKTREIILKNKGLQDTHTEFALRKMQTPVRRLVSIAKSIGLVPENCTEAAGLVPDTQETWERIIDHFDIQFGTTQVGGDLVSDKPQAILIAREVLTIGLDMWNEIDFDDQMYMTVVFNVPMSKYDIVFVDEAQDVSDIQRAMLTMCRKKTGRLIAVGDPCQAIYGFRGADSESLANIAKTFNAISLPLSISYRCPKAIVAEAQKYVSHIESHESAPEGEVEDFGIYAPAMFKSNDMVVCRNTAPLIKLAYKLISAKIPATIMGRDIGKGLVTLINKLKAKDLNSLCLKLSEWRAKETQRALNKDPEADLSKIDDKYEIIIMFIDCSGADTIPSLITAIENLFGDKAVDAVVLSTIHRAKGMEADRVFILDSWLMPSKYARKPWQRIQERNLQYVGITRAKKSLFYVNSPKKDRGD